MYITFEMCEEEFKENISKNLKKIMFVNQMGAKKNSLEPKWDTMNGLLLKT